MTVQNYILCVSYRVPRHDLTTDAEEVELDSIQLWMFCDRPFRCVPGSMKRSLVAIRQWLM